MSRTTRLCALLALGSSVLVAACSSDEPTAPGPSTQPCTPGAFGCMPTVTAGSGSPITAGGSGAPAVPGGTGVPQPGGSVAPPPGTAGSAAPPVVPANTIPCDVAPIISDHCTGCHQNPPKTGAPMPLLTLADFQAAARSDATKKVYQVIPGRISATDPSKRMPQAPLAALTMAEQTAVNNWLSAGAPAAMPTGCAITVKEIPPTTGNPDTMVPTGGGSGGAHITPIEYNDPEMQCYKFLTHAPGDKTAKFSQPRGEQYVNFDFKAPWTGTVYERATLLANDPDSQVIHHWLLFKQSGPVTDGAVQMGSTGIHPDGTLIHAWGPGASPIYFDPDVGVALESTVGYRLEAHFNNSTGGAGLDSSGAEVCVTPKKPEHIAELVWVGSDSIAGTSATGSCRPRGPFPIHVIAAQPHMHKLGTHMKVTINRADGKKDVVHDLDFSFDSQQYYVEDFVLNEGDTMTTNCSYSGFATFGQSTSNEMCYFFSLAWPSGALRSGGGSLIHGPNSCM